METLLKNKDYLIEEKEEDMVEEYLDEDDLDYVDDENMLEEMEPELPVIDPVWPT